MKNRRILLVGPFPPPIGGVSISSQRLYEHLINAGYEVEKFDIKFSGTRLNRYKLFKILRISILPFNLILKDRYDVIHFHVSGILIKLYISLWRFLFSKSTKFILTIHGDVSDLLSSSLGKHCLFGFDLAICVKEGDKKILQKYFRNTITEIPAFIPPLVTDDYEKFIPEEVNNFINKDSLPLILWNGSIITEGKYFDLYGLKVLINVFIKLINIGIDSKLLLLLLGDIKGIREQRFFDEINMLIDDSDLRSRIFIVRVKNTDLWPVLKKASVFVRPTLTDGDALSVREALYLNIPVVASDVAQRPLGTIVYNVRDESDLLIKIREALGNMNRFSEINSNYAYKIIEQYEAS